MAYFIFPYCDILHGHVSGVAVLEPELTNNYVQFEHFHCCTIYLANNAICFCLRMMNLLLSTNSRQLKVLSRVVPCFIIFL